GDRGERRDDHPPPRGWARPRRLDARRGRGPRDRAPARGEGAARPGRDHEPGEADSLAAAAFSAAAVGGRGACWLGTKGVGPGRWVSPFEGESPFFAPIADNFGLSPKLLCAQDARVHLVWL